MTWPLYTGTGTDAPDAPKLLPPRGTSDTRHPRYYIADQGLVDAANTALLLRQPLLLTGEPGTGKTQFAASLSWELGLGERILRFDAKSHSKSRDLFYTIDTIGWFQAAKSSDGHQPGAIDFITYNAFGQAILLANPLDAVHALLPPHFLHAGAPQRSVVLIDEIDKAPRDFPNDILSELDDFRFRVPELKNVELSADPDFTPIVILSSNSEKDLPDAFLRRCIYYDIPFPEPDRLAQIVRARLREAVEDDSFIKDALSLFDDLRSPSAGLRKRPATAELLGWIAAMRRMAPAVPNPLSNNPSRARSTLSALVKTHDDLERANTVVAAWIQMRNKKK
jgi:MoxR-like ATPase